MTTDPNNEARDLLKRLVEVVPQCASCIHVEDSPAYTAARDYLKRTEPAHLAKKAFQEWWGKHPGSHNLGPDATKILVESAGMYFYRKGMEDSAEMVRCNLYHCDRATKQRILNAAKEVPVD